MIRSRWLAVGIAGVVGSGAVLAFYGVDPAQQSRSTERGATPPDEPRSLERSIVLAPGVGAEVSVSLLPTITTAEGRSLRPIRINALYLSGPMTLVGQTMVHELLSAESRDVIDLSAHGLDIGGPIGPEQIRSFTLTLVPNSNLTWGTVDDPAHELVLHAAPADR